MDDILKPQLYDAQSGAPLSLPEEEIPQAIAQGKAAYLKGDTIPVVSPDGTPGTIPADQAHEAFRQGYKYEPASAQNERGLQKEYGEGPANEGKAFLAGAARGLTFGLSDVGLTKSGLVKPETLKELENRNPISSITGNIAGAAAPIILTGGTALGVEGPALVAANAAREAGVVAKGASVLGALPIGAAKIGAGIAEGVAGRIGGEATQSLAKHIVTQVISKGAGSAVEGALYGAGNVVSEAALGDPELTGQKVASEIGFGALVGGAFGATLGGLFAPLEKSATASGAQAIERVINKADEARLLQEAAAGKPLTLESAAEGLNLAPEQKSLIGEGLSKLKANHQEIIDAAAKLDAPVLEGQIADSKFIQDLDSKLTQKPNAIGVARQAQYAAGFKKSAEAIEQSLGQPLEESLDQVGSKFRDIVNNKFQPELDQISNLYNSVRAIRESVPVPKELLDEAINKIKALPEFTSEYSSGAQVRKAVKALESADNIERLKFIKTEMNGEAGLVSNQNDKRILAKLSGEVNNLVDNSVLHAANELATTPEARAQILAAEASKKEADKNFSGFIKRLNKFSKGLGSKEFRSPGDFLDYFNSDKFSNEAIVKKFFPKGNVQLMKFIKSEIPEGVELLNQYEKTALRKTITEDNQVNINRFLKEYGKMSPELRQQLFSFHENDLLGAVKTYIDAMPENVNPSHTSKGIDYSAFLDAEKLKHPIASIVSYGKDYASLKMVQNLVKSNRVTDQKIGILMRLEQVSQKVGKQIGSAVESFVKQGGAGHSTLIGGAVKTLEMTKEKSPQSTRHLQRYRLDEAKVDRSKQDTYKSFQRRFDEIASLVSDPEGGVDKLTKSFGNLPSVAPGISSAMQQAATRGAQFLYEKAPKNPNAAYVLNPNLDKWHPSDAAIAKWERYVSAVDNPLGALKDLKNGMLTHEAVEAIKTVYPSLHQEITSQLMDHLTDLKHDLPYQKKIQLSTLFGVPLSPTLAPGFIQTMQAMHHEAQGEKQAQNNNMMGKGKTLKSSSKIAQSKQSETERILRG